MKKLVEICADCLKDIRENKIAIPRIFIIFNQRASLDIKRDEEAIGKLVDDLDNLGNLR